MKKGGKVKALLHDSLAELSVACRQEQGCSLLQAVSPLLVPIVKTAVSFCPSA